MELFALLNFIDIIAIFIVILGVWQGYRRRLSGELAHLISVIVAFFAGLYTYVPLGQWLGTHSRITGRTAVALTFFIIIIVSTIVMVVIRLVLKRVMRVVIEEEIDKVGGCIAGFIRSTVFIIIVFIMMNILPHNYLNRLFGEESAFGNVIIKFLPSLRDENAALPFLNDNINTED